VKIIKTSQASEVASRAAQAVLKQRASIKGPGESTTNRSSWPPIIIGFVLSQEDTRQ